MNLSRVLDLAIKQKTERADADGYAVGDRVYDTYLTNTEWQAFLDEMPRSVRDEYGAGGGDELTEKNGRPPKMASYASSSRMIYLLSRGKAGFHFEKKLPTTLGGTANLDGFCDDGYRYLFVEAKCHEPYFRKSVTVSRRYEGLYRFLNETGAGGLEISMHPSECGRYMDVEYFSDGERLSHFDVKQMLCHLLGIASGLLRGELSKKQIDFIYLLYDPTELPLPDGAREEIGEIYERTCYECNLLDFATLLQGILLYLREEHFPEAMTDGEIAEIAFKFTFSLASQELYPLLLQ